MRHPVPLSLLLLGLAWGQAVAAERPWWQFWGGVAENAADAAAGSAVDDLTRGRFTPDQRVLLRDFLAGDPYHDERGYRDAGHGGEYGSKKAKPLPPGLRKKLERGGQLPPGWQKKLARGEVVDDQVWRQSRRLPPELLDRLGPLPADTEIRYVEDKVYRVVRDSREILDILGR